MIKTIGIQGPAGPRGATGAKGDTGSTGAKGDTGLTGATGGVSSLNGRVGAVVITATDIGLPLANNTADSAKPVSTAQAAADAVVATNASNALTAHTTNVANPHAVTPAQIGAPSGSGTSTGVNTGDQTNIAGNAGTATALQTARNIDGVPFAGTANITVIAPAIIAAPHKAAPADLDSLAILDSAAANSLANFTFADLKAAMKSYFDSFYSPFSIGAIYGIGELGLWYDPSDLTTGYQDSAGTTAAAINNPIGKRLDKSGRGNHAFQATASARPVLSARLNLMTKTEQLDDASAWLLLGGATTTSRQVTFTSAVSYVRFAGTSGLPQGNYAFTCKLSCPTTQPMAIEIYDAADGNPDYVFGLTVTPTPTVFTVTGNFGVSFSGNLTAVVSGNGSIAPGSVVTVHEIQLELGTVATPYQRVNTATDYDTVGFPVYASFDGVDDALSTGAITLGADMDCFIAVRRNSATGILTYTTPGSGVYLGAIDATAGAASAGAGTPTYAANGVDVAGGTGTTRAQLAAAVPVGSWVIVEIRDANLSAWAAFAAGAYTGFLLSGQIGGIVLCPAQSDASRANIRRILGAKVGLSL